MVGALSTQAQGLKATLPTTVARPYLFSSERISAANSSVVKVFQLSSQLRQYKVLSVLVYYLVHHSSLTYPVFYVPSRNAFQIPEDFLQNRILFSEVNSIPDTFLGSSGIVLEEIKRVRAIEIPDNIPMVVICPVLESYFACCN